MLVIGKMFMAFLKIIVGLILGKTRAGNDITGCGLQFHAKLLFRKLNTFKISM